MSMGVRGIRNIFVSAVSGEDGRIDAGYLALFWTMFATINAIPVVLVMAGYAISKLDDFVKAGEIIQQTGVAIGAICTGAGVVIGAVGAFRAGDKVAKAVAAPGPEDR
jgi:asparagine N-glycosylation enzyme membrane subunit Stt3